MAKVMKLSSVLYPLGNLLANDVDNHHTQSMSLKNAALLAMIGTAVLTILLILNFVNSFLAFMHGLIPATVLLSSLLYAFAALSVAVFFYIFHRAQS
jgi:hypothetical protein